MVYRIAELVLDCRVKHSRLGVTPRMFVQIHSAVHAYFLP